MHNYLQANYTTANNWRSGVEILKQIQPLARPTLAPISMTSRDDGSPGIPVTPDYPATSPAYQPQSPDYGPASPQYDARQYALQSPDYGPASPQYDARQQAPKSPEYGAVSPQYAPPSPEYGNVSGSDSPGVPYIPTPPAPPQYTEPDSYEASKDLDFGQFGGTLSDIRFHKDNNSVYSCSI